MNQQALSLTEFYIPGRLRDKKSESAHLKVLARKINKVPDTINIPRKYFVKVNGIKN